MQARQPELSLAVGYVASHLYNKLPRRRVDCFVEELEKALSKSFETMRDETMSQKRRINVSGADVDQSVTYAADACGLGASEVQQYMPQNVTVWIEPGQVSYQQGESGKMEILYSKEMQIGLPQSSGPGVIGESLSAVKQPIAPLSEGTDKTQAFMARQRNMQQQGSQYFTTTMFAQTKFGSTKLRTNKKSSALSPTNFSKIQEKHTQRTKMLNDQMKEGGGGVGLNSLLELSAYLEPDGPFAQHRPDHNLQTLANSLSSLAGSAERHQHAAALAALLSEQVYVDANGQINQAGLNLLSQYNATGGLTSQSSQQQFQNYQQMLQTQFRQAKSPPGVNFGQFLS